MIVKRPVSASLARAFFYIVLLSILSTGIALLTLASSLRDAEAINIAGSLRMQSYRLGYDLQSGSPQLNAHRQLFQQALHSPVLTNLNVWYVPEAVKTRYAHLNANWLEMNNRLSKGDLRATIARELHDSLAQVLSYLRIQLTLLKRSIPEDNATAQSIMADFSQALNDAYRQLRELLTTFRLTLQQADLPSALREMLDTLQNQTSAKLTLDCRLPTLALDAQMQVHLLQIIREAVLNAMKHANASEIAVSCVTAPDGNHTVYIRDNGIGIGEPKEPEGHYGLNIMRERAERLGGTLTFSQPSGGGTLVSISFRSAEGEESQLM